MKIHILGIAGTFMSGIAILAKQKGHDVTGSDLANYDPIKSVLDKNSINVIINAKLVLELKRINVNHVTKIMLYEMMNAFHKMNIKKSNLLYNKI